MELSTGGSTLPELWEAIFQLASLDVLRAISCFELNAFIDTQAIYVMLPGPSVFQHDHGGGYTSTQENRIAVKPYL